MIRANFPGRKTLRRLRAGHCTPHERHQALGISLALQRVSRQLVRLREQAELEQTLTTEPAPVGIYTRKAQSLVAGVRRLRRAS